MYKTNNIMTNLLTFITLIAVAQCYLISKQKLDKRDAAAEKRYSNGTVIGKYEYVDKDGNPVELKYYADDNRYGVELNSVRIVPGDIDLRQTSLESKQVKIEKEFKPIDPVFETMESIDHSLDGFKFPDSNKVYNTKKPATSPKKTTKEKPVKTTPKSDTSSDYEIYMPNDFKTSNEYSKDVRVYNFEKKKRLIRDADDNEMPKICEMY